MNIIKAMKNLGFIIKESKREKIDPSRRIIVCPSCQKPTLKRAPSSISGWLTASMYFCTDPKCNYMGYLYAEITIDDEQQEQHQDIIESEGFPKDDEEEREATNGKMAQRSDTN